MVIGFIQDLYQRVGPVIVLPKTKHHHELNLKSLKQENINNVNNQLNFMKAAVNGESNKGSVVCLQL